MSRVPMMGFNPAHNPALAERMPGAYVSMGITAENLARKYQVTREAQQDLAIQSHRRAAQAWEEGRFKDEVLPIQANGTLVDRDGTIRPDTTQEALSGLQPAFDAEESGRAHV